MTKKVLIILGHPAQSSFCEALTRRYAEAVSARGHDTRFIAVASLRFDPIFHQGYGAIQPLEPDLLTCQELIRWADHLVWFYPTWWGTLPALLKGFIDRVFLPGFAFRFRENSPLWDKLLTGRTAQLFVTMDSPGISGGAPACRGTTS